MKLILIQLLLFGCLGRTHTILPPDTEITASNANKVSEYDNTPESVAMYFFASKIRNDNKWEKVCPPKEQRSKSLERKLNEYQNWTFKKYQWIKTEQGDPGEFILTVDVTITYKGEEDGGEDQMTIQKVNGKLLVMRLPG